VRDFYFLARKTGDFEEKSEKIGMIINMADLIPLKAGRNIYGHCDLNDIFQFINYC